MFITWNKPRDHSAFLQGQPVRAVFKRLRVFTAAQHQRRWLFLLAGKQKHINGVHCCCIDQSCIMSQRVESLCPFRPGINIHPRWSDHISECRCECTCDTLRTDNSGHIQRWSIPSNDILLIDTRLKETCSQTWYVVFHFTFLCFFHCNPTSGRVEECHTLVFNVKLMYSVQRALQRWTSW